MEKKEDIREVKAEIKKELKEEFEEEKIEEILKQSEISLWLDTYDDLFSDFDPRPFSQRAVSVDFLDEIKRASRDKASGQIELRFLIPKDLRKTSEEEQIKRRLKDHFKKHTEELVRENRQTLKRGISIGILGFVLMFFAVAIDYFIKSDLLRNIITTLFEPSGWFMMFYGFDTAFYGVNHMRPEIEFYQKMAKAEVSFVSY